MCSNRPMDDRWPNTPGEDDQDLELSKSRIPFENKYPCIQHTCDDISHHLPGSANDTQLQICNCSSSMLHFGNPACDRLYSPIKFCSGSGPPPDYKYLEHGTCSSGVQISGRGYQPPQISFLIDKNRSVTLGGDSEARICSDITTDDIFRD